MLVCIVTSKHVSYNPRVVKEADALTAAGHAVTVVTVCNNREQALLDQALMRSRQWRLLTVNYRRTGVKERLLWLSSALRQRLFRGLDTLTHRCGIAERAQGREFPELQRLACAVRADLYLAHHVEALGAAWAAARRHGARLAFDAEDFHSGMYTAAPTLDTVAGGLEKTVSSLLAAAARQPKSNEQQRVEYLEQKYLPRCAYVTAASDGIALAYALKYRLPRPATILNVFPLEDLDTPSPVARQPAQAVRLYWYSQVIGPGRGLEEAVRALPLLTAPCELHLRGTPQTECVARLKGLAEELGVGRRLFLHPPCPPDELVREAARHDIGLALENAVELNRLICVTNKIFTYLNAGLAVAATDTPGQAGIMAQVPEAGVVCRMNDARSLAGAINALTAHPERLSAARQAARRAAEVRYNWGVEGRKVVRL